MLAVSASRPVEGYPLLDLEFSPTLSLNPSTNVFWCGEIAKQIERDLNLETNSMSRSVALELLCLADLGQPNIHRVLSRCAHPFSQLPMASLADSVRTVRERPGAYIVDQQTEMERFTDRLVALWTDIELRSKTISHGLNGLAAKTLYFNSGGQTYYIAPSRPWRYGGECGTASLGVSDIAKEAGVLSIQRQQMQIGVNGWLGNQQFEMNGCGHSVATVTSPDGKKMLIDASRFGRLLGTYGIYSADQILSPKILAGLVNQVGEDSGYFRFVQDSFVEALPASNHPQLEGILPRVCYGPGPDLRAYRSDCFQVPVYIIEDRRDDDGNPLLVWGTIGCPVGPIQHTANNFVLGFRIDGEIERNIRNCSLESSHSMFVSYEIDQQTFLQMQEQIADIEPKSFISWLFKQQDSGLNLRPKEFVSPGPLSPILPVLPQIGEGLYHHVRNFFIDDANNKAEVAHRFMAAL